MFDAPIQDETPPAIGTEEPDDSDDKLVAAARAAAKLARQVTIPLGQVGLSLPQYRVLAFLDEGDAAPSDLAGRLSVSRPSITALMDGLVTRGLVERQPGCCPRRRHEFVVGVVGVVGFVGPDGGWRLVLDGGAEHDG